MCNIWRRKEQEFITAEQVRSAFRDPVFDRVEAVGLNGGEPTLRKDLGDITQALFDALPALRSISLITNAYKFDEVIERISDVGEIVARHSGKLDVMISLDGVGAVHDQVRGKPGNFARAERVIDFISSSVLVTTKRVGCTIVKHNVYGLDSLFDYCRLRNIYIKYRLGIPHKRLYTENLIEPYSLTFQEKYHIVEFLEGLIKFYEENDRQKFFYRSLIDQLLYQTPRQAGCDWKHRAATVTAYGELLYCAVQSKTLGRISEQKSSKLYFDNQAHLREIIQSKCSSCTHDYVGIPPRRQLLKETGRALLARSGTLGLAQRAWNYSPFLALRQKLRYQERSKHLQIPDSAPRPLDATLARHILICGWYGTETLGDKAILGGIVDALKLAIDEPRITIASLHPYVTRVAQSQMPELDQANVVTIEEAVRLARDVQLVVFGGGPLMALVELADMVAIFRAAAMADVPTVIAGCGVGPLGARHLNSAIRELLTIARLRIYRDDDSRHRAAAMGVGASSDVVAEDPAFSWLAKFDSNTKAPTSHPTLLLGLRDFPWQQYAADLGQRRCVKIKETYERSVRETLATLVTRRPDLRILPLPMCTNHFGDDDRWFYRRILDQAEVGKNLDTSLLSRELTPADYVEAFRSADAVMAMRYHSLVFALGLRVPAVAIDYTLGRGKVKTLAERFGVPCMSLESIASEELASKIDSLLGDRSLRLPRFEPLFASAFVPRITELLAG